MVGGVTIARQSDRIHLDGVHLVCLFSHGGMTVTT
jgi:hypothetical protein